MQFNEKLKELRTKKGVSQSELADGIYVSRSAVAKWENGLGLPSNESLRLLAEYFDVTVDELYADSSTEKTIVNKNQIISRSRRLLIIISTACAVAVTAIIILAIFLGYHLNKPASHDDGDDWYTGPLGVKGQLYGGGVEFDYENNEWQSERSEWKIIEFDESTLLPTGERTQVKYTLTAGQSYVLCVSSSPGGYNGVAFGITFAAVELEYNSDIFDIVYGLPKGCSKYHSKEYAYAHLGAAEVNYLLTVKKPCQDEPILLYRGERTDDAQPSFELRINAAVLGEE